MLDVKQVSLEDLEEFLTAFAKWCLNVECLFDTKKEQEEYVQQKLNYLIAEGLVVKVGNKYRKKTKKEQQQELKKILQD